MTLTRLILWPGHFRPTARNCGDRTIAVVLRPVFRLIAWVVLSGFALCAHAISLQEYVTDVVNSNPLVREQVHAYRQVAQDHKIALSGWRPSLDLSSTFGRSSRRSPNTSQQRSIFNEAQVDLTLTQNLFDGFDTTNQIAQARARISSAAFHLYDTADNVALDAVRAYLNVLTEKRLLALAVQNVETHERIFSQIQERNAQGIGRLSDLEQTEGRVALAHSGRIAEQNNLQDALTEVHKLLGRYVSPEEFFEPSEPPLLKSNLEALAESAIAEHPAVQSAVYNIEAARFDYQRSRSTNLPNLNLQLQQSVGDNVGGARGNLNEGSVTLLLQYNLYRGGADLAEQRKKISVMHESQAFLARVRRQVIDSLRLALTAYSALHEQLPFLQRHAAKSQSTLELYEQEFLLQKRDLIDVLDAENEWNRALGREAEAHYLALVARFRVYEALGNLFQPLKMNVEITQDDLHIANITASGIDAPELSQDRDLDGHMDQQDQCDNTPEGSEVDNYGCRGQSGVTFGMSGSDQPPQATEDVLSALQNQTLPLSTPAQVQVVEGGEPVVTASLDIPKLEIVQFGYKQLTLTEESQARINTILEKLSDHPGVRIEANAFTDNIGSAKYNRRLSESRAQAMKQMLVNAGFDEQRITAVGMGEDNPIADNATEAGRASNRRGEIRFILPGD